LRRHLYKYRPRVPSQSGVGWGEAAAADTGGSSNRPETPPPPSIYRSSTYWTIRPFSSARYDVLAAKTRRRSRLWDPGSVKACRRGRRRKCGPTLQNEDLTNETEACQRVYFVKSMNFRTCRAIPLPVCIRLDFIPYKLCTNSLLVQDLETVQSNERLQVEGCGTTGTSHCTSYKLLDPLRLLVSSLCTSIVNHASIPYRLQPSAYSVI